MYDSTCSCDWWTLFAGCCWTRGLIAAGDEQPLCYPLSQSTNCPLDSTLGSPKLPTSTRSPPPLGVSQQSVPWTNLFHSSETLGQNCPIWRVLSSRQMPHHRSNSLTSLQPAFLEKQHTDLRVVQKYLKNINFTYSLKIYKGPRHNESKITSIFTINQFPFFK